MLFLPPHMLFCPLSPLTLYPHFSIGENLPEPPAWCVRRAPSASLLGHLSWITNKLTCGIMCSTSVPCSPEDRNRARLCSWPSANKHLINMWSFDEINECTNSPKKPEFMSEGKWLPSLLAHSFPHVPPNRPGTFVPFLGSKGSVWLS